jgi:hypothetical protein
MTGRDLSAPPELFPVHEPEREQYALAHNMHFGWSSGKGDEQGTFRLSKLRWTGGSATIAQWPLTHKGWEDAWRVLLSEYPPLADAVAQVHDREAQSRAALRHRAESQAALAKEGPLQVLAGCVLLGGYGYEPGVAPGDHVDLHFTLQSIWMSRAGGFRPYLRRSYESARSLDFEGGAVRQGGGYRGGGFGLAGAAEGIAMAALLNSLTAKTSIQTTVRIQAQDAEVFLFTDQAVPRDLEMRLAEVRGKIRAAVDQPVRQAQAGGLDISERLLRLGEMLDKGQLTPNEFAQAKARLLSSESTG